MSGISALGLFSGGLDSILACRVIAGQGIGLVALKFVTPFFDYDLLERRDEYTLAMRHQYGLAVEVVDLSSGYLDLLKHPAHGFGKNFNPCIDCKILMLSMARAMMPDYGASFLVTGEVLGQRPMSQRRDTLRVIERDSGCEGILLRPLCAKLLPPTRPELEGLVNRERLYAFSGRGRKEQARLAASLGISGYPNPAGGCMLTDPNLGRRIKDFYHGLFSFDREEMRADDLRLLTLGRQFRLAGDLWLIIGRDERENKRIGRMRGTGDCLLFLRDRPGPLGLLRHGHRVLADPARQEKDLPRIAGILVHYGKKSPELPQEAEVLVDRDGSVRSAGCFPPVSMEDLASWRI